MDENVLDLLREAVVALTQNGQEMKALPRDSTGAVKWLSDWYRGPEADRLRSVGIIRLRPNGNTVEYQLPLEQRWQILVEFPNDGVK